MSLTEFKRVVPNVTDDTFEEMALALFHHQSAHNLIYKTYLDHLGFQRKKVKSITDIPFLPIAFFKHHKIQSGNWQEEKVFKSSGTSATGRSKHYIEDLSFYLNLALKHAETFFGGLSDKVVLGLLPSYQEQGQSSLIAMVDHFIRKSGPESGYVLGNEEILEKLNPSNKRILLFGVSYALLDLAESNSGVNLSNHIVLETGGMKGRRREMTKEELHKHLKEAFQVKSIYGEYGMTELLSQAYGSGGHLRFPAWCRALVRDINDPFDISTTGSGAINIIDLANAHSCAFIETKDLGIVNKNGYFSIIGRMDNSDIRGCSLLI